MEHSNAGEVTDHHQLEEGKEGILSGEGLHFLNGFEIEVSFETYLAGGEDLPSYLDYVECPSC